MQQGRLAGAGGADQRDRLARPERELGTFEDFEPRLPPGCSVGRCPAGEQRANRRRRASPQPWSRPSRPAG